MDGLDSDSDSSVSSTSTPIKEPEQDILSQDEEPEPEVQPTRLECEMPYCNIDLGEKIFYVKLPNFLSIDTHEYDPLCYMDEIDENETLDNEGNSRMKLKVENTIRWRTITDEDGNETKQSNARIVEWSDGTMSLHLGSEIFDITEKSMGECSHLFMRLGTGLQGQAIFNTKLSIRPHSTESFTHRKLTLSIADRSQKTQKIRMLHNPGVDPEARLGELSKKEDDKFRKETKQRRVQERSQTRGPSASFLEPDYDEDDDGISLAAIKRGAIARGYDDESSTSSDDSDPEFGKIKKRPDRQIVEDDSDED